MDFKACLLILVFQATLMACLVFNRDILKSLSPSDSFCELLSPKPSPCLEALQNREPTTTYVRGHVNNPHVSGYKKRAQRSFQKLAVGEGK